MFRLIGGWRSALPLAFRSIAANYCGVGIGRCLCQPCNNSFGHAAVVVRTPPSPVNGRSWRRRVVYTPVPGPGSGLGRELTAIISRNHGRPNSLNVTYLIGFIA